MWAIKKTEVLIRVTTWIHPGNVMLSGRRYKKPHAVRFHVHEMPRIDKSAETGSRLVVARGQEEREVGSEC